jgi:hypothetical protein
MQAQLAIAVRKAAKLAEGKRSTESGLNSLEIAAEEFHNATTSAERAEALKAFIQLVQAEDIGE